MSLSEEPRTPHPSVQQNLELHQPYKSCLRLYLAKINSYFFVICYGHFL